MGSTMASPVKNPADSTEHLLNKTKPSTITTIGNTLPNLNNNSSKEISELELRQFIHDFVKSRPVSADYFDESRIPKKFRQGKYLAELKNKHEQEQKAKLNKNRKELELLANRFRQHEERTLSGLWKLTLFYSNFGFSVDKSLAGMWEKRTNGIRTWIDKYPQYPTSKLVYAGSLLEYAFSHRMTRDWEQYHYYILLTRKYLEEIKVTASKDPHWYVLMLLVAISQDWPLAEFLNLMEEGTSVHPYYYQIYFTGMNYLSPRWHGNKEKIEAFADAAVEKTREKEKTGMYARVYWYASQAEYGHRLFTDSAVVWNKMRQGIFDVIEQYPDQWNLNNFAYFSCLAKDKKTTKILMKRISLPIDSVWEAKEVYQACKDWADKPQVGSL